MKDEKTMIAWINSLNEAQKDARKDMINEVYHNIQKILIKVGLWNTALWLVFCFFGLWYWSTLPIVIFIILCIIDRRSYSFVERRVNKLIEKYK